MVKVEQIETLSDQQIDELHALYQNEWWSENRELDDIRQMLEETNLVVAFLEQESGRLVAFCRLLTDFTYHAILYDVIVHPEYRDQGLGRQLMEAVIEHPRLKIAGAIWLCCLPEMMPFYEKWGFEDGGEDIKWMRLIPSETV